MAAFGLDSTGLVNYNSYNYFKALFQWPEVTIDDYQEILPVTKVKRELLDIIKVMGEEDSTIALTRNGQPVGVMMTPGRYEALLETIEILADKKVLSLLKASASDFKSGKVHTDKDVWDD